MSECGAKQLWLSYVDASAFEILLEEGSDSVLDMTRKCSRRIRELEDEGRELQQVVDKKTSCKNHKRHRANRAHSALREKEGLKILEAP